MPTIEMYLSFYTKMLFGGIYTIFVLSTLVVSAYFFYKMTLSLIKAIDRHIQTRMQPRQILDAVRKGKEKLNKHFEVKLVREEKNGKKKQAS